MLVPNDLALFTSNTTASYLSVQIWTFILFNHFVDLQKNWLLCSAAEKRTTAHERNNVSNSLTKQRMVITIFTVEVFPMIRTRPVNLCMAFIHDSQIDNCLVHETWKKQYTHTERVPSQWLSYRVLSSHCVRLLAEFCCQPSFYS